MSTAFAAFLVVTAGIGAFGAPPPQQETGGVEWHAKQQTVMVEVCQQCDGHDSSLGAGVVVGETKDRLYILTAYHVVYPNDCGPGMSGPNDTCTKQTVRFLSRSGKSEKVPFHRTSGYDVQRDLAALEVFKADLKGFPTHFKFNLARNPGMLRRGDHLFMIGFANDTELWSVPAEPFFFAALTGVIQYGPAVNSFPGASGGPLCNADGEIVGIVLEKGNDFGRAVPVTKAIEVFEHWKLGEPQMFAERRFPIMKPRYTEIGADVAFPSFTGGLAGDGPGVSFHVAHGITRLVAATFDASVLYAKSNIPVLNQPQPLTETQQILIPSGGLQLQPFAGLGRKVIHENLGGLYLGGGLGWAFVSRSIQTGAPSQSLSSLMLTTEIGYRFPLPPRGWGLKIAYKVYQPLHSDGVERASSLALGLYGVFR